ncbi:MAG: hypothetical protein JXA96_17120 [Sedimentisphaerales bacterium]|nr:hypothetical protein [Sedimentisphaerales bacterium]
MAFEIYRTRQTISGQQPNVIADYNISTGGREMGRAISEAGSVLMSLGDKWDLQIADTQFTRAKAQAREEYNRYLISRDSIEPDDIGKSHEEFIENLQQFTPKNKRGASAFGNWLTSIKPYWNENKNEYLKARITDDYRATGYGERQKYIETGAGSEYFIHLEKGVKLGAYSREEAAKYKQYAIDDRMRYAKIQQAEQEEKAKQQLELQRETDRDKITDLMREHKYTEALSAIEAGSIDEQEQFTWSERIRSAVERYKKGEEIITDYSKKQDLLDYIALIPENKANKQEAISMANEGRYGKIPYYDDKTYDEIRDAVRSAVKDEIPYSKSHIEDVIGALVTGSPVSMFGFPLKSIRTRQDAMEYATNELGRFATRIPEVLNTINAIYSPEGRKELPEGVSVNPTQAETKGTSAFDFDGKQIGYYNPDGSITLNMDGAYRLWEAAGRNAERAREIVKENRYVIPFQVELRLKNEPQKESNLKK